MDAMFPASWNEMLKIISNPLTMGVVLSILIEAMPFIKDDKVSDWIKLLFVLVVCLIWSTLISLLTLQPGQPITAAWVYADLALGIGVMFSTQAFHKIRVNWPDFSAFLLALFGKPTTQTTIDITAKTSGDVPVGTLGGTAIPPTPPQPPEQPLVPPTPDQSPMVPANPLLVG